MISYLPLGTASSHTIDKWTRVAPVKAEGIVNTRKRKRKAASLRGAPLPKERKTHEAMDCMVSISSNDLEVDILTEWLRNLSLL